MMGWMNVAAELSPSGWEYWLALDETQRCYSHVSVSGSPARGWRVWHVSVAPGLGERFSDKRYAFERAEILLQKGPR